MVGNMGNRNGNGSGSGRSFEYFLVKPILNGDAHRSARRLAKIHGVREVALTEGEYGFIVKADISDEQSSRTIRDEIAAAVGGEMRTAVCHCRYSGSALRR